MRLGEFISRETGVDLSQIMLLRHSTDSIEKMEAAGVTLEEYTALQPPGTKYDFQLDAQQPVLIVVVVVRDSVAAVFRVLGVNAEGNLYALIDDRYRHFNEARGRTDRPHRLFEIVRIPSEVDRPPVTGWRGREIVSVARSHMAIFSKIEVSIQGSIAPI